MELIWTSIDVDKSIAARKIYSSKIWSNRIEQVVTIVSCFFMITALGYLLFIQNTYQNSYAFVVAAIELVFMFIAILYCYRAFRERQLFSLKTNFNKHDAEEKLNDYFNRTKHIRLKSPDGVLVYEDRSPFVGHYQYIVFPLEQEILFAVIKQQQKWPFPVVLSIFTTRKLFRQLLQRKISS